MAAASLTVRLRDRSTGRIRSVNGYASDASATAIKFDEAKVAVAGSADYLSVKSDGDLIDICFTSDVATPTHVQVLVDSQPTGDILDITAHLASVVNRPNPHIFLRAGQKLQLTQVA